MAHHLRVSLTGFTIILSLALLFTSLQAQVMAGKQKQAEAAGASSKKSPEGYYVPVRSVVYRPRSAALPAATTETETETEAAGSYQPFAVCEGCRCCSASNASSCLDTSCCYSIDCNLPGKPFGTCAFTPQSCGCVGGTNNCTQPS